MAKKSKGNRIQVILECTEHKESGMPGTSRYITTKNRKNTPERMELRKYNPILRRVTLHREIIKMVKSPKTGAYTFKEQMVPNDQVKEAVKK